MATLELRMIAEVGLVGIVYIISRILGKFIGARVGGQFSSADKTVKIWMGIALLPQAGVAIGMALVASSKFPEHRQMI